MFAVVLALFGKTITSMKPKSTSKVKWKRRCFTVKERLEYLRYDLPLNFETNVLPSIQRTSPKNDMNIVHISFRHRKTDTFVYNQNNKEDEERYYKHKGITKLEDGGLKLLTGWHIKILQLLNGMTDLSKLVVKNLLWKVCPSSQFKVHKTAINVDRCSGN